jgi:hypothetical protein
VVLIGLYFVLVIVILNNIHISELQAFLARDQHLSLGTVYWQYRSHGLRWSLRFQLFLALFIGPFPATVATALGNTLTALVHYQVGKHFGDIVNFEEKKTSLPFQLGKLPVYSVLFLLAGRAAPGGPVGLSFVCGAYSVPYFAYVWTTFITNLIGAALVAYSADLLLKL